ncbi:MAG: allantoinase AllB [Clostridia bacterium]|nr:allantoinase AllB [Clostridia bacterium]
MSMEKENGVYDLIVAGGRVVTETLDLPSHVLVRDGRVAGLLDAATADLPPAREVLDASGLLVLPGGVDAHVHFRDPGLTHKEDWESGSVAAAAGGVTTVLDMPNTDPPTADAASFALKVERARGRAWVDFGLFGLLSGANADRVEELARAGAAGLKVFLGETTGGLPAPDVGELWEALRTAAAVGLRVGFHAEDRSICRRAEATVRAAGLEGLAAHAAARPPAAEAVAVDLVAGLARLTGCPVHVFHLSSSEGVEAVARARAAGVAMTAETCPHYLLLSLGDPLVEAAGAWAKVNPPLREGRHAAALWEGLLQGTIDYVASDHAPHAAAEKATALAEAPAGTVGVETALPLLLTQAAARRLPLRQVVRWFAAAPARTWGLYPRKGSLLPGADADLVVVDPQAPGVVRGADLHGRTRATAFEGMGIAVRVVYTVVRGQVVWRDGALDGEPQGRLVTPAR